MATALYASAAGGAESLPAAPHIQRIPVEIRNRIYELVLISENTILRGLLPDQYCLGSGAIVDIQQEQWPALLDTCKQFRYEAASVYLLNNRFFADLHFRQHEALFSWLHKLETVPIETRQQIPQLAIHVASGAFEEDFKYHPNPCRRFVRGGRPNFRYWDDIILELIRAQLLPTQINWTGEERASRGEENHTTSTFVEKLVFNEYVLIPLLQHRHFYDAENPPMTLSTLPDATDAERFYLEMKWMPSSENSTWRRNQTYGDDPRTWCQESFFPRGVRKLSTMEKIQNMAKDATEPAHRKLATLGYSVRRTLGPLPYRMRMSMDDFRFGLRMELASLRLRMSRW